MKSIYKAWFCHIEVTNFCKKSCIYCSRWTRHLRDDQYFYMTLPEIDFALEILMPKQRKSATTWPNRIGIMGGEPTLHPEFEKICELLLKRGPKERYGLWTYGGKHFDEYRSLIDRTFGMLAYNEHNEKQLQTCKHQPATVAIGEVIKDDALRERLIDNCWVQLNWCPSIAQSKAHFCEVAYGIDRLFELDSGWELDYNWFLKDPGEFDDQVNACCHLCGMAVPMERQLLCNRKELITPKLLQMMKDRNLKHTGDNVVEVFNDTFDIEQIKQHLKTWDPRNYRLDLKNDDPLRPSREDKNYRYHGGLL